MRQAGPYGGLGVRARSGTLEGERLGAGVCGASGWPKVARTMFARAFRLGHSRCPSSAEGAVGHNNVGWLQLGKTRRSSTGRCSPAARPGFPVETASREREPSADVRGKRSRLRGGHSGSPELLTGCRGAVAAQLRDYLGRVIGALRRYLFQRLLALA